MATFVESAILKLIDRTSRPTKKINRELKALERTAAKLKKTVNGITFKGFAKSLSPIKKLNSELKQAVATADRLKRPINLRVNTGNANASIRRLVASKQRLNAAITPRINTSSINRAITRVGVLNSALAQSKRPVGPTGIPSVGGRRPGGINNVAGRPLTVKISDSSINRLSGVFSNFTRNFGEEIARAMARALVRTSIEGANQSDIAENRILSLSLKGNRRKQFDNVASDISDTSPIFNRAQSKSLLGEILPQVEGDIVAAGKVVRAFTPIAREMLKSGSDFSRAQNQMVDAIKIGTSTGAIFETGGDTIDPNKMRDFIKVLLQAQKYQGKDFDPTAFRSVVAAAGSSKFALSPRQLLSLAIRSEDLKQRAATGSNQLLKVLRGGSSAASAIALADLGLVTVEQVQTGAVGSKKKTQNKVTGVKDAELLATDLGLWLGKHMIPALKEKGIDTASAAQLAAYADQNKFGRIVAKDAFVEMILQFDQHAKELRAAQSFDVSSLALDSSSSESSRLAVQRVVSSFTGAMGALAESIEGPMIRSINVVTSAIRSLESYIVGDADDTESQKQLRSTAVVGGALLTGVAGIKLAKKGLQAFGVGRGSAALIKSSVALDGSALALTRAAVALGGAGVAGGGIAGVAKKGAVAKVATKGLGVAGALGFLGRTVLKVSIVGIAAFIIKDIAQAALAGTQFEKDAIEAIDKAKQKQDPGFNVAAQALKNFVEKRNPQTDTVNIAARQNDARIDKLQLAVVDAAKATRKQILSMDKFAAAHEGNIPDSAEARLTDLVGALKKAKQALGKALSASDIVSRIRANEFSGTGQQGNTPFSGGTPATSQIPVPEFRTIAEQADEFAGVLAPATTEMATQFQTAFATGSQQITDSANQWGPAAAAILGNSATQFGNTAGAAIMKQISNLNLNITGNPNVGDASADVGNTSSTGG